jgi:secreted PhoX family phosphatase
VKSTAPLVINEVLPSNSNGCADEVNERNDWVELYNKGDEAVDLGGYSITDDTASPRKSVFPDGLMIEAQGVLLLWADKSPDQGKNHLAFKFMKIAEGVTLYDPEEKQIDQFRWTNGATDISFARIPDGTGKFIPCFPTCGTTNGSSCGH